MATTAELFTVLTPSQALEKFEQHFSPEVKAERIPTHESLGRVLAEQTISPEDLPSFNRSSVDGFAVRAADTYGATPSLPAFLQVIGEAPMGRPVEVSMEIGEAVLVHTGSMIPPDANAVVMVEHTQAVDDGRQTTDDMGRWSIVRRPSSIEVMKPVAEGDNVIQIGEDVRAGTELLPRGHRMRPQDIGALLALGITSISVSVPPRVGIISTGDEVIPPDQKPLPGQVRDVNSYALAAQVIQAGGIPVRCGIVPDDRAALKAAAARTKAECDIVVLSAGSSVSYRDMSVEVIGGLGQPGVLVHGVSVKPGKPTIIAVCDGVPVFGLPGNPASAMVTFDLFVAPAIQALLGMRTPIQPQVQARLTRNIPSTTGREDYVPVMLEERDGALWATPVFGKSNLIYILVRADGTVKVSLDLNGIRAGEMVTVYL